MGLWDILSGAGHAMDLPGSSIRDVLSGRNPLDQYATPFSGKNRVTGRRMLETLGLLGANQPGLDAGDVAGFGVEVATDPLGLLLGGGMAKAGHRGLLSAAKGAARKPTLSMAGTGAVSPGGAWDEVLPVVQRQAQEMASGLQRDVASPALGAAAKAPLDRTFHLNTLASRTLSPWSLANPEQVTVKSPQAFRGAWDTYREAMGDVASSIPYTARESAKTGATMDPVDAMRSLFGGGGVYRDEEILMPLRRAYQSQAATFGGQLPDIQRNYENILEILTSRDAYGMDLPEVTEWLEKIRRFPEKRSRQLKSTQVLPGDPDYLKSGLSEVGGTRLRDEWAFRDTESGGVLGHIFEVEPELHHIRQPGGGSWPQFVPRFYAKVGDEVQGPFMPNPREHQGFAAWNAGYDQAWNALQDAVNPVVREGAAPLAQFEDLLGRGPLYRRRGGGTGALLAALGVGGASAPGE